MKLKELKKEYEISKCDGCYSLEDYLDYKCAKPFDIYYSGWEMDTKAWLMEDGTIFTTDHGSVYEMSLKEFKRYRKEMKNVVSELNEINKILKKV